MIDKISYVENANQEIDKLAVLDLRHEAVADKKFVSVLGRATLQKAASVVTLDSYQPNELVYDVNSDSGGIIVFSEVYYPGWTAAIDGKDAKLGRADYILRALSVRPGRHKVVLTFKPQSIKITETVAYISYGLLVLALLGGLYFKNRNNRSPMNETKEN